MERDRRDKAKRFSSTYTTFLKLELQELSDDVTPDWASRVKA
jgi:hypothetical protein